MVNTSNWWVDSTPGPPMPGSTALGGGGSAGNIQYRNPLDAARTGKLGQAQYPDGYLGTIVNRNQDKLLAAVKDNLNKRSYQRGVHVGSRISPRDYFWDRNGVDPDSGLKRDFSAVREDGLLVVKRHCPSGNPVERLAHLGKTAGLTPPEQMKVAKQYGVSVAENPVVLQDPTRKARMSKMLPSYAM